MIRINARGVLFSLIVMMSLLLVTACSQSGSKAVDTAKKGTDAADEKTASAPVAEAPVAAPAPVFSNGPVVDKSEVQVHYTLTVDGKVEDSSEGRPPITFVAGAGQMIPGFDKAVHGMQAGEKKSFDLSPAEGYGEVRPEAFQEVPKDQLPADLKPEAGMTLYAKGPGGQPIPVKISEVRDKTVMVDMNHPLAGKTLHFDIEVVSVQ